MESATTAQSRPTEPQSACVVSDQDPSSVSGEQQSSEQGGVCVGGGVNLEGVNLQTKSSEEVHYGRSPPSSSTGNTPVSSPVCANSKLTGKQQTSAVSYEPGSWCLYAHCTASSQTPFNAQRSGTEKDLSHSQVLPSKQGHEDNKDAYHSHMQSGYKNTPEDATTNVMPSESTISSEQLQRPQQQYELPSDDYRGNQTKLDEGNHSNPNSSLMHQNSEAQTQYIHHSHSDEMHLSSRQQLQGKVVHCEGEGDAQSCSSGQEAQSGTTTYLQSTDNNTTSNPQDTHCGAANYSQDNQGDVANCLQDAQGSVTYLQDTQSGVATYSQAAHEDTAPCPQFDTSTQFQAAQSNATISSQGSTESLDVHGGTGNYIQDPQTTAGTYAQDSSGTYSQEAQSGTSAYSQNAQTNAYSEDTESGTDTYSQDTHGGTDTYSQDIHSGTGSTTYSQDAAATYSQNVGSGYLQDAQSGTATYPQDAYASISSYSQTANDGNSAYSQDTQSGAGTYSQDTQSGIATYSYAAQGDTITYSQDGQTTCSQSAENIYPQSAQTGTGTYSQDAQTSYSQSADVYPQSAQTGTGTYSQDAQTSYSQSPDVYQQSAQTDTGTCSQDAQTSYSQSTDVYPQSAQTGTGTYSQDAQTSYSQSADVYPQSALTGTGTYSQDAQTSYSQSADVYPQSAQTGTGTYSQDAQTSYSQSADVYPQSAQTGTGTYSQDAQTSYSQSADVYPQSAQSTYSQDAQTSYSQSADVYAQTGTGTYSQDAQTSYSQSAENIYPQSAQTGTGTYSQDAQTSYSQSADVYPQSAQTGTGTYSQDAQTSYSQRADVYPQSAQTGTGTYSQDAQTSYSQSADVYPQSAQTGTGTYSQDAQTSYSQNAENVYPQSVQTSTGTDSQDAQTPYSQSSTSMYTQDYAQDTQDTQSSSGSQNLWDVQGGAYSQSNQSGVSGQQTTNATYPCNNAYSSEQYTQYQSQYPQQEGYTAQYSDGTTQHNSSSSGSEYANHYNGSQSGSYYYDPQSAAAQQHHSTQQYAQTEQSQQQSQVYGQGYASYGQQGYQQGYYSNEPQTESGSQSQNYQDSQEQSRHWGHGLYGNQSTGSHPQNQQLHAGTNYPDPPDSASSYYYEQQQGPLPEPQQWPQPPPNLPPLPPPVLPPHPPPPLPPHPPPTLPPHPPPAHPPHPLMPPHPQLPPLLPQPPQPPHVQPPQSLPDPQWPHHPAEPQMPQWLQQQYSQDRGYNSEAGCSEQQLLNYPGSAGPWRESGHRRFRGPPHHWRQRRERQRQSPYDREKRFGSISGYERQHGRSPSFDSRSSPSGSSTPSTQGYSPKYSPSKSSSPQCMETESQSSPGPKQSPVKGNFKEDKKEVSTTFSKQLHDPRQTQAPPSKLQGGEEKHYTRTSKYAGFAKNPVHKRSAMLKLNTWKHKSPDKTKGPQLIQPHHQKSESDKADSTEQKQRKSEKSKATDVHLSPKPLASFRIPKHKSSSEKKREATERREATEKKHAIEKQQATEKRESTEKREATEKKHSIEKQQATEKKSLGIQSQPESTLKTSIAKSDSKNDVASILSSCDPTALKALALTIQQTLLGTSPVAVETSVAAKVTKSPLAIVPAQKICTIEMDPSSAMELQSSIGESTNTRTIIGDVENMDVATTLPQSRRQVPTTSLEPTATDSSMAPSQPQMAEKGVGTKSDPPHIIATVVQKPLFPVISSVQSLAVPNQNTTQQSSSLSDTVTKHKVTTATPVSSEVTLSTANSSTITAVKPMVSSSSVSTSSPSVATVTNPVVIGTLLKESMCTVSVVPSRIATPTPIPVGESQVLLTSATDSVVTTSDPESSQQASVVNSTSQAPPSTSADVSESSDLRKEISNHPKDECTPESKSADLNLAQELKPSPDPDESSDATSSNSGMKPESQALPSADKKGIESERLPSETTEPASIREMSHFLDYFDPRFMFKEYNLRRTHKPPPLVGVAGGMPPTKKQKREPEDSAQCKLSVNKEVKADSDSCRHEAVAVCGDQEQQPESASVGEKDKLDSEAVDIDGTIVKGMKEGSHNESRSDHMDKPLAVPCQSMNISTAVAIAKSDSPTKQGKMNNKKGNLLEVIERIRHSSLRESDKQEDMAAGSEKTGSEKPESKHARMKKSSPVKRSRKRRQLAVSEQNSYETIGDILLCALCRQRANIADLGFLFGPYEQRGVHAASNSQEESINLRSDSADTKLVDFSVSSNQQVSSESFWVHEDCVVWAPGVCLVNNQLMGLEEAVSDATKMVCSSCKKSGATLCCSTRGCKAVYHYPCASDSGCSFKREQFLVYCPRHKDGK